MTPSFLYRAFCRVLQLIRFIGRRNVDLAVEVVMLRHEVAVLRRQVHRPMPEPADRAVLAGLARLLPRRRLGRFFVKPDTLLRWHRDLVTKHWPYPRSRLLPGGQDEDGSGAHDEHESRPAVTIVSVRGAHAVGTVERLGRAEMVAGTWISRLERAPRAGRPS